MAWRLTPVLLAVFLTQPISQPVYAQSVPPSVVSPAHWQDDSGQAWTVPARLPARWVVLGPHLVDMVKVLGEQQRIVGVQDDHPVAGRWATSLSGFPVVGQSGQINEELVRRVHPDLIVYWPTGLSAQQQARLRSQGIPLLAVAPTTLQAIPQRLRWLGWLSGRAGQADAEARRLELALQAVRTRNAAGPRIKGFYQVWQTPLYSLAPDHLLSQALRVCGVDSIVPATVMAAPVLSPEFVLRADPDVILVASSNVASARQYWGRFPSMKASQHESILPVDDVALTRPGLSLLQALPALCDQLRPWRQSPRMSE